MLEKTFLILQENLRDFLLELVVPVSRWMFSGPDLLERDRDEEVCIKWDDNADKDFSHHMTESEYFRYKQNWWISLNKTGNTGPLRKRSDFNQALSTLDRSHHESGKRKLKPALLEEPGMSQDLADGIVGVRLRVRSKPKSSSLITSMSADVCLSILTEISCQATSWQSGWSQETRLVRQLESTTASKRCSLKFVHIPAILSEIEYSPDSTSVQILSPKGFVLVDEPAESLLCGFALAFDRLAKSLAFTHNAYSSNCTSKVSCSLLFKFMTNLFKP